MFFATYPSLFKRYIEKLCEFYISLGMKIDIVRPTNIYGEYDKYKEGVSHVIRILYGGSIKPGNIADLMSQENIDGGLVGGASLDAESFAKIVNYELKT